MGRFDKVKKYEDFGFLFLWKMMKRFSLRGCNLAGLFFDGTGKNDGNLSTWLLRMRVGDL